MIVRLPGDTEFARLALLCGGIARGWTRVAGAPRNADINATLRDLDRCGVGVQYNNGAIVIAGNGPNPGVKKLLEPLVDDAVDRVDALRKVFGEIGSGEMRGAFIEVPGDAPLAMAWIVAALLTRRQVVIRGAFVNRQLARSIDLFVESGALIEIIKRSGRIDIEVYPSALRPLNAELPIVSDLVWFALLASGSGGSSCLFAASHQCAAETGDFITALGGDVRVAGTKIEIDGTRGLRGGAVKANGRITFGLAAAIASLVADNDVLLEDAESVVLMYPGLLDELQRWNGVLV